MNCRILLFIFCLALAMLLPGKAMAQKDQKVADAHFQKLEYAFAIEAYKKLLQQQQPNVDITTKIAHAYRLLNNPKEAEFWYGQMIAFPDYNRQNLKHFADAARMNGNYNKAKQLYLEYADQVPNALEEAKKLISITETAQHWVLNPAPYALEKQKGLNSINSDFSPVFYQNGVVFTSDRENSKGNAPISKLTGKPFSALYFSPLDSTGFGVASPLPSPLHNKHQNGSAVFSADGTTIYFTRINQLKKKGGRENSDPFSWVKFTEASDFINRLEIFISQKNGDNWSDPTPFPYNNPTSYSIGQPALSLSGDTLYFASDMPGSLGQSDIFYSVRQPNNSWSKPVNLGPEINTPQKEVFPVVSGAGKLYFSSTGHVGLGGLDIFSAQGSGNSWKNVKNLRYPLNSSADDFGILFEKTGGKGYLSSNRESEDGTDNIFRFAFTPTPCRLAGRTFEKVEVRRGVFKETAVGKVQVRLYQEGDTTSVVTYSDAKGNFSFDIRDGVAYTIKAIKPGYLIRTAGITPACESIVDMVKLGMALNQNTLNRPILLDNIYYDFDKYDIRPDAALELDQLVQTLQDNPNIRIELSSHTDSRQTHAYNNLLSQMRAQTAVNYLISKGISPGRLVAKGYGETQPLNKCKDGYPCSEKDHQVNRRTEFKILKAN